MKKKIRIDYLIAFVLLLLIEVGIGLYVRDDFIRPYVGDVLVIILLCCLIRILFPNKPKYIFQYAILIGVLAELSQYFHLDKMLGVQGTVFGIILGSTFDVKDIVCYIVGGLLFGLVEFLITKKQVNQEKNESCVVNKSKIKS